MSAGAPVFEDLAVVTGAASARQAVRIEPGTSNLLPASVMGTGLWTGESAISHQTRARAAVASAQPVITAGLGSEDEPIVTAQDTGTAATPVTLWALLEALDAERVAAGMRDANIGWIELLHVLVSDASALASTGGDASVRTVSDLGTGPNGGRMLMLAVSAPRMGAGAALAILGLYANHLRAILHHAQLEELPAPTSPIPAGASRDEERIVATTETVPPPRMLAVEAVEAVAAPWAILEI